MEAVGNIISTTFYLIDYQLIIMCVKSATAQTARTANSQLVSK